MSELPFMPLYVADLDADTGDLSCEEFGAYVRLLMTMWRHGAELPNDQKKLSRIARISGQRWTRVWAEIERFFIVNGDVLTQKRLQKVYLKQQLTRDQKVRAGRAKALKYNNTSAADAGADAPAPDGAILEPEPELKAAAAIDPDLERRCREAGGDRTASIRSGLGAIEALIEDGYSLEDDVLPAIRGARDGDPVKSWRYYADRIRDHRNKRTGGPPRKPDPNTKPKFKITYNSPQARAWEPYCREHGVSWPTHWPAYFDSEWPPNVESLQTAVG